MRVSVVIPCFNVAAHVSTAVRSVMAQTHTDLDVLVLDDGSTDGTGDELSRLMAEFPGRLRIRSGPNTGACAARNRGWKDTTGEYVQFLDADDELDPDKIARQVALAERAGMPALVAGGYRNRYEDGHEEPVTPLAGDPWEALVRTALGTTSANLWKRSALEAVGGWREDLASSQDYELMFRLMRAGGHVVIDREPGCTVLKRTHGSISRTHLRENWQRYIGLRASMRDHLMAIDAGRYAPAIAVADQYIFNAIRVLAKYDRQAAFEAYGRTIPPGFIPMHDRATGRLYVWCYRLLGFRMAERIAGLRDTLRPAAHRR